MREVRKLAKIFIVSDTHFGHKNIVTFLRQDGAELRPWGTIEDHDAAIIENWNSVVRPQDKVYHLGDFGMAEQAINRVAPRLNGHKRIVLGNHDTPNPRAYINDFEKVCGAAYLRGCIMTHIPVNPQQLEHRFKLNIHGHMHGSNITTGDGWVEVEDKRYFNACLENINFTPIDFEEILAKRGIG